MNKIIDLINKNRNKMKNLKRVFGYAICIVLTAFLFTACDGYPVHTVCEGKQNMIVYKMEKVDSPTHGTYKYAVTDASGKGWELRSFTKFSVGDTLRISK